MSRTKLVLLFLTAVSVTMSSCKKDDDEPNDAPGQKHSITIKFAHHVFGDSLELDTMKYTNAFGNLYRVENLKYLISNITLHKANGSCTELSGYHYIDISDAGTLEYTPDITIDNGDYESISFTMGFDDMDNVSGAYLDLNVLNWGWPMMLGGGYHFMKLEGKYVDAGGSTQNFATHYGTAREITQTDTIFHANHFTVDLPSSGVDVVGNMCVEIKMDINNWYNGPPVWDFNVWDGPIMPVYEAQVAVRNNGVDVFSVGLIEEIQ